MPSPYSVIMEQNLIRGSHSLGEKNSLHQPFEIGPTWNLYVAFCSLAASPMLIIFLQARQKGLPFDSIYRGLVFPLLMLLYLRSRIVRLDREGVTQGFPILGTSIRYEDIESIHREIRSGKGASTPIVVISKRDSKRRIVVVIRMVDDATLRRFIRLLKEKAPQLFVDDLILAPSLTALER